MVIRAPCGHLDVGKCEASFDLSHMTERSGSTSFGGTHRQEENVIVRVDIAILQAQSMILPKI